jgi:hypothetical protein
MSPCFRSAAQAFLGCLLKPQAAKEAKYLPFRAESPLSENADTKSQRTKVKAYFLGAFSS